jgi:hypothetical protein
LRKLGQVTIIKATIGFIASVQFGGLEKMEIGWVKSPSAINGLDQLGTQSPCTLIYAQLLPGITNVTDRARYYSLYPWIVRSLDLRYKSDSSDEYIQRFRRADCLLTLIAERHARKLKDEHHGEAMIGRQRLVPALSRLENGEPLRLSTYATQSDDSKDRYFQNRLGGMGQYYLGQLAELRILDASRKPWVSYTPEGGTPLAQAVDLLNGIDDFWRLVDRDRVTLEDLDSLEEFCICGVPNQPNEHKLLMDLFLAKTSYYQQRTALGNYDPDFRARSLRLLLHLANALSQNSPRPINEGTFRAAVYSGYLLKNEKWDLPEDLAQIRALWSIYERNDLLSVACLCIFSSALQALDVEVRAGRAVRSVESFAAYLSHKPEIEECISGLMRSAESPSLSDAPFSSLVEQIEKIHPPLDDWQNSEHEIQIALELTSRPPTSQTYPHAIRAALHLIALLSIRASLFPNGYGDLLLRASDLENYPINLVSIVKRIERWRTLPLKQALEDLIAWCLNTHLSVALRKLRQTRQSSFHLQPTDSGLKTLGSIPDAVPTLPRIWQALQILADMGALSRYAPSAPNSPSGFVITHLGQSLLEGIDA